MIKPHLQYSVPCLGFDESKGPPSFMFVFYELPLEQFPYRFPETAGFFVVNGWVGGQGTFQQRLVLKADAETVLVDTDKRPFTMEDGKTPFMSVNFVQGIEFPRPGAYTVEVYLDDELMTSYTLLASQAPPEEDTE